MHIRTFLKPLSFIPAILMMYIIFTFSAQSGDISSSVSYKASCVIVKTADNVFDMGLDDYQISNYAEKINGVTRKLAHMTEYFLLAVAVSFPLYVYGLHGILLILLAGGLCIAFACGDEYHQSFVAGRSPSMRDVGIDSVGVLIGIILVRIVGWTGRMTIFRPFTKEATDRRAAKKAQKKYEKQMKQQQQMQSHAPSQYNGPQQGYNTMPPQNNRNGYPQMPPQNNQNGYSQAPYQNGYPAHGTPYNGYSDSSYPNNNGQSNGYQNNNYPNNGYQNTGYPNQPYQNGPYPYPPQSPQYMGQQPEHSSDELADDMPLSHLFKPKK